MSERIWIDTTTGTWGAVQHGQGALVICDVTPGLAETLEDASDSEIADYGLKNGRTPVLPSDLPQAELLYTKCAHCHLFVDHNPAAADDDVFNAPYTHLHRGDDADTRLDESHEPEPSPFKATLATWRVFGPSAMRERFIDLETGQPYTD